MDAIFHYGLYILVGTIAGLLSGLLGVGGGIIVVPAFVWSFEFSGFSQAIIMQLAAGTSLAAMIVTTAVAMSAHYSRGAEFSTIFYYMIPGLTVGSSGGALLAHFMNSHVLRILFALLLLIIALKEFFIPKTGLPVPPTRSVSFLKITLGSLGIGLMSGLVGVGGGVLTVPFLQYCGVHLRNAVAISVACGLVIAIIGTITFIIAGLPVADLPPESLGYVYLPAAIGVSMGSPLFAVLGTRLHHYLPVLTIKRTFSVFLIVVAFRLLM